METLYVAVGMILGGISALIIMAMFFVSGRAEENQDEMSSRLTHGINYREIPSSSSDLLEVNKH